MLDCNDNVHLLDEMELYNVLNFSYEKIFNLCESLKKELNEVKEKYEKDIHEKNIISDQMKVLLSIVPVGIVIINKNGFIELSNKIADDIFEEELYNKKWNDILDKYICKDFNSKYFFKTKKSKIISISTQSLGITPGQVIILLDQTDVIEQEKENERKERLSEMGKMASVLAHQIRTPLSTCLIYSSHLLKDNLDKNKEKTYKIYIYECLKNINNQVNNILIFAKGGNCLIEKCDLFDFFESIKLFMQEKIQKKNSFLNININKDIEEIYFNKDSMTWVFNNLILNSLESKESNIEINIRARKINNYIVFEIEDNGPGIDSEIINKIKEPFFTTKPQGTGLGLSVANTVVQSHGGYLDISNKDNGTLINIFIPLSKNNEISNKINFI